MGIFAILIDNICDVCLEVRRESIGTVLCCNVYCSCAQ